MNGKTAAYAILNSIEVGCIAEREVRQLIKSFFENLGTFGGVGINQGCCAADLVAGNAQVVDFTKIGSNEVLVVVQVNRGVGAEDL